MLARCACQGNAILDNALRDLWFGGASSEAKRLLGLIARTELLIRFGLDHTRKGAAVPAVARRISAWWYRLCYQRVSGIPAAEIDAWRLPLAIAWQRGQDHLLGSGLQAAIARWRRQAEHG